MDSKVQVDPAQIDLVKLKGLLRYGDAKAIAKSTGYSHPYVLQVLNPNMDRFVDDVIIAAVNLVSNRDKIELDVETASLLTKSKGKNVRK